MGEVKEKVKRPRHCIVCGPNSDHTVKKCTDLYRLRLTVGMQHDELRLLRANERKVDVEDAAVQELTQTIASLKKDVLFLGRIIDTYNRLIEKTRFI